jgi:hypothetical protein
VKSIGGRLSTGGAVAGGDERQRPWYQHEATIRREPTVQADHGEQRRVRREGRRTGQELIVHEPHPTLDATPVVDDEDLGADLGREACAVRCEGGLPDLGDRPDAGERRAVDVEKAQPLRQAGIGEPRRWSSANWNPTPLRCERTPCR